MERAFSPLDEELELGPAELDPGLVESVVLLGTVTTFERAPQVLAHFTQVPISAETARRLTEAAGQAQVALETAEVARLEQQAPPPPAGPPVQQLSVDGAMVPLVGGEWAEVKTLAIGTVELRPGADGLAEPRARELSYFSRLTDAATFRRLALMETQRRGTVTAGRVGAIQDGAEWVQGFVDFHRPDAVRILDFPHAVEHLSAAAQAVFGAGTPALSAWLAAQCHALKHGDPDRVLAAIRALPVAQAPHPAEAAALRAAELAYLEKRRAQIEYAAFRAQGYPIGSGAVESANKLVVEARLKGSGMHWARPNVNPLVALRGVLCSERWAAAWPSIWGELRRQTAERRQRRHIARRATAAPAPTASPVPAPPPATAPAAGPPPRAKLVVDGRPTANHPWRRRLLPIRQAS